MSQDAGNGKGNSLYLDFGKIVQTLLFFLGDHALDGGVVHELNEAGISGVC